MGVAASNAKKKIDEITSNSSLSNLRYVTAQYVKPKWKFFSKNSTPQPRLYGTPGFKPTAGCPCGNTGPCKQKVTPRGVTMHYPQKKKAPRFFRSSVQAQAFARPTIQPSLGPMEMLDLFHDRPRPPTGPKGFSVFRSNRVSYTPYGTKIVRPRSFK